MAALPVPFTGFPPYLSFSSHWDKGRGHSRIQFLAKKHGSPITALINMVTALREMGTEEKRATSSEHFL